VSNNELPVLSLDEARMNRAAWAESNLRTVDFPIDPIEQLIASPERVVQTSPRSAVIALALSVSVAGLLLLSAGIGVAQASAVLLKQSLDRLVLSVQPKGNIIRERMQL
jgi:hypothetical protein